MRRFWLAALAPLLLGPPLAAQPPDKAKLAADAKRVLTRSCSACHPGEGGDAFDATVRNTMLGKAEGATKAFITPGKLADSYLWDRIADGSMPRRGSNQRKAFRPEDKEIIRKWIEAGAPDFPKEEKRDFIPLRDVLKAIRVDLQDHKPDDRKKLRYFTLTHLHNTPSITAEQLRFTRAALAKVVNSLSWRDTIEVPRAVDKAETILAVDIEKLGWTADTWKTVLNQYPYGLRYTDHPDETLKDIDKDIQLALGGAEEPFHVRADWFVVTASRPPLYHTILYDDFLPDLRKRTREPKEVANPRKMTDRDLEAYLRVDVLKNIFGANPLAVRAGFAQSGVSGQNRLIERHPLDGRAYWKSYDFKASTWEANLLQFPLGPKAKANPFDPLAFKHDGGEIIFNLPNGLQGYLLVDGKGNRIDEGPIEVVSDGGKTSGTPLIANGLSCMSCHKTGMVVPPPDLVREGAAAFGKARDRVRLLYPEQDAMKKLIKKDSETFVRAAEAAMGKYLRFGPDKDRPFAELPEPVAAVAHQYLLKEMDLATVAAELYLPDPAKLKQKLEDPDSYLRRLGLGALLKDGGTIKRAAWESVRGSSQMQQSAREMGFTPYNFRVGPR